jgi:hypothetical protein
MRTPESAQASASRGRGHTHGDALRGDDTARRMDTFDEPDDHDRATQQAEARHPADAAPGTRRWLCVQVGDDPACLCVSGPPSDEEVS